MRFSCLQENLTKGLSVVNRFVSPRTQLPILANILLVSAPGELKLGATNLETGISLRLGAKTDEEGEIAIPAKTLVELVGSLPAGKIDFSTEGSNLKIASQKFQAVINGMSAQEFPPFPVPAGKQKFSFKKNEFILPVSQTAFAAAGEESRPTLSGIKIFKEGKELLFVATDGYRLSLKRMSSFPAEENLPEAILPARTLTEVARILSEEKEEAVGLEIAKEGGQAIFRLSQAEIFCRLLEGQFPNFEKIIPTGFSLRCFLGREELSSAVKTAAIFAREAANIVKFKIHPSAGSGSKFEVSANAPQVGENTTEIEAKIEGEDGEIAFNTRFLQDFLSVVSTEEIVFEMQGPLSPGVFKVKDDDSFLHIIMPVRLQE